MASTNCNKFMPFIGSCTLQSNHADSCLSSGGRTFRGLDPLTVDMNDGEGTVTINLGDGIRAQETFVRDRMHPSRTINTLYLYSRHKELFISQTQYAYGPSLTEDRARSIYRHNHKLNRI